MKGFELYWSINVHRLDYGLSMRNETGHPVTGHWCTMQLYISKAFGHSSVALSERTKKIGLGIKQSSADELMIIIGYF